MWFAVLHEWTTSDSLLIRSGVKQGCVLAPILCNVFSLLPSHRFGPSSHGPFWPHMNSQQAVQSCLVAYTDKCASHYRQGAAFCQRCFSDSHGPECQLSFSDPHKESQPGTSCAQRLSPLKRKPNFVCPVAGESLKVTGKLVCHHLRSKDQQKHWKSNGHFGVTHQKRLREQFAYNVHQSTSTWSTGATWWAHC